MLTFIPWSTENKTPNYFFSFVSKQNQDCKVKSNDNVSVDLFYCLNPYYLKQTAKYKVKSSILTRAAR